MRIDVARWRGLVLAVGASALLHAALMAGVPGWPAPVDERAEATYAATLDPEAPGRPLPAPSEPAPVRAPSPPPRAHPARAHPRHATHVRHEWAGLQALEPLPALAMTEGAVPALLEPTIPPVPERVALAAPTAAAAGAAEPGPFPVDAVPADLSIDYRLTSSFAEGHANYRWRRDGDSYRISGSAEAEGFFALFLEGQILQETRGTITASGLQPASFSESKPGSAPEGLEFDWERKTVVFDRNGSRKTAPLQDNTVDWLSMIFQLAHRPPQGEALDMRVFTQRKMYTFRLQVLGTEEIDIPLGHVRALHLKHVDPDDGSEVDVWLGVDNYYMPVKMRYPVAKNRLTVEQVATSISARQGP